MDFLFLSLVFFPKAVFHSARRSSSSSNKHYGVLMDKMEIKPPLKEDTETNFTDWRALVRLEFRQSVINHIAVWTCFVSEASVEVLESCRVSLPPEFITPQAPNLTFFDLPWLFLHPVQRLFFYSYSGSRTQFMSTDLPNIKHSLSLTLQHFYPLSGTLTWPPESKKPQIRYYTDDDNSGVMLKVAETDQDFHHLAGDHPRNVNEFHPLISQIPSPNAEGKKEVPVLTLQITLFPNTGICIGISSLHVVADGKTTIHFMKFWASVCKSGLGDTSCLHPESLPYYDRSLIVDAKNLERIYLNHLAKWNICHKSFYMEKTFTLEMDKVRATFLLGRSEIQKLRRWVQDRFDEKKDAVPRHLSSFVLTMAYVWACLFKVMAIDDNIASMETMIFFFAVDCRERMNPPLPTTYFGNCLMGCFTEVKTEDLVGEDGIAVAAKGIGNAIQKMISIGVLEEAAELFQNYEKIVVKKWYLSLAGSPKLGVYDTDFGWGRPKKVEVISVDTATGSMSVSESGEGEGGIEIGLVLNKLQMDSFASLFARTLSSLA